MKSLRIAALSIFLLHCQSKQEQTPQQPTFESFTIALGSCNQQDLPQPMWPEIIKETPDLWIWLGDNIYGDSEIVDTLIAKYDRQNQNEGYRKLLENTPIIGTWDDHDYGKNDGGVEFTSKVESQKAYFDFMGKSPDDPIRDQEGVYSIQTYQVGKVDIKIIMLDSRYHRDPVDRIDGVYQPNESGTVLGEEQWRWLEDQLTDSEADLHIVGNGIQVISREHRFEKWGNFPNERERLFQLVRKTQARGVIFLTGDRHIAEISELNFEGIDYPLRDFTASGLTHSYEKAGAELNQYRISPLVGMKNFGVLDIIEGLDDFTVQARIRGLEDTTFFDTIWTYPLNN